MTNFKRVSLNVRGINNFHKRRTIFNLCRERKADVIFLQETHSKEESETQWKNEWGGKCFYSHGSPNSRGVMVLIRNKFNCTIQNIVSDPLGRFIVLKVEIEDKIYVLRAVCCKDQLRSCNIEKTDVPKLCQNKGLGELVQKI